MATQDSTVTSPITAPSTKTDNPLAHSALKAVTSAHAAIDAAVEVSGPTPGTIASDLIETDECFAVGHRRMDLVIDAIGEMGALCEFLRKAIPSELYPEYPIVRGLSARIEDLADAVVAALTDAGDDITEIAQRVHIDLPKQEGRYVR